MASANMPTVSASLTASEDSAKTSYRSAAFLIWMFRSVCTVAGESSSTGYAIPPSFSSVWKGRKLKETLGIRPSSRLRCGKGYRPLAYASEAFCSISRNSSGRVRSGASEAESATLLTNMPSVLIIRRFTRLWKLVQ